MMINGQWVQVHLIYYKKTKQKQIPHTDCLCIFKCMLKVLKYFGMPGLVFSNDDIIFTFLFKIFHLLNWNF